MQKRLLIIMFILLFLICGCTNNSNSISSSKINKMQGTYLLYDINKKGKTYDKEKIESVKYDYAIIIDKDNQGQLILNKEVHFITYDSKYLISTNAKKELEKTKYKFKDNKIIVYYNGTIYTFKKNDNKKD